MVKYDSIYSVVGGGLLVDPDGMVAIYAVYGAAARGYTESIAGVLNQLGIIGRKYMGDRLLTGEF